MASTGAEIANAYVALTVQMPGVKKDIESALGQSSGASAGRLWSSGFAGAVGGAVASVATRAMDSIAAAIDGAVSRVDTLNNFPKVMANLGYESGDAADSIEEISDKLTGLPTTLDSVAGMVQQLAPLTDGLGEATDLSLALNNALLAGGQSADIQANAMQQYTQMLSVGKVDMAAWNSLVTAMPGQMNQVSEAMLGSGASAMDLYAALQEGRFGFDDLNAAILELNSNGTGEFASFAQQAQSATDGIATSQQNLQTAVTRGMAKLIEQFAPQITMLLEGLTALANEGFGALSTAIAWMAENSDIMIPVVSGLGTVLLVSLAPAIWGAVAATWAFTTALLANPITWVVLAIGALVAAIVALAMNWDAVVAWVSDVWGGFLGWMTGIIDGFVAWWDGVWTGISDAWSGIWEGISNVVKSIWNGILGFIEGGVNGAIDLINGMTGGLRDAAGFLGIEIGEIPHVSIPRLAEGGVVQRSQGGTLAVIGEGRYDEAVVPLSPDVLAQLRGGTGQGGVQVDVHPAPGMDEAAIGRIAGREVSYALRG